MRTKINFRTNISLLKGHDIVDIKISVNYSLAFFGVKPGYGGFFKNREFSWPSNFGAEYPNWCWVLGYRCLGDQKKVES